MDGYRDYQERRTKHEQRRRDRYESKVEAAKNTTAEDSSPPEVEKVAAACLRPAESVAVSESSVSAADYIRNHYDVEPADHRTDNALLRAMSSADEEDEEG